jgi:asparagine synthase (glutamine-hydrolysing)
MCGIFGALGRLPEGILEQVSRSLRHRGPDGEGRFVDGEIALLHRRLKVIDLSKAADQPMGNEDGSIQVVFNGEIYNHRELRRQLESRHLFRSQSDTESIVHGYEEWGESIFERLDGMFAVAIWDRNRKRLLLGRDRAGKKPLFYCERAGFFRFGSSIASLIASGLAPEVDFDALPMYLSFGYVPAPGTFYRGVKQLGPGEQVTVSQGGRAGEPLVYWKPCFEANQASPSYREAKARVRALVTAAVERRLESEVPLGAFLSGGVDSTIVVGLMAKRLESVRTFSIGFAGDPSFDETHYARLVAGTFGTEHTEFTLEPSSFELVESLVRLHDGPFGDSSAIPAFVVSRLTRQHVTVALTGDGGDELFCGYSRLLAAEASEWLPLPLRKSMAFAAWLLPRAPSERTRLGRARRFLDAASLSLEGRLRRWNSFFPDPAHLLNPDVAAMLTPGVARSRRWHKEMVECTQSGAVLSRILEYNFRTYLPNDLLVKTDRTSMASGLETRSPFLDTALIEYVATLPSRYLRRGLLTKRILKDAFSDLLPMPIRRRGKMGFGVPLGTWFRGALREYLHDYLDAGAQLYTLLDRTAVQRLLSGHANGRADHGQRLWVLLTLEIWLRCLKQPAAGAP